MAPRCHGLTPTKRCTHRASPSGCFVRGRSGKPESALASEPHRATRFCSHRTFYGRPVGSRNIALVEKAHPDAIAFWESMATEGYLPDQRTMRYGCSEIDRFPVGRDQVYGAGSGSALAELKACTPASLSPSNGVGGVPAPRQKSSSSGSANHTPIRLRSTRTRAPSTTVEEKASCTMRLKEFW